MEIAFHCSSQLVGVGVRQKKDRFFLMIDVLRREARLIVENQRNAIFARDVFGADDRKFVPRDAGPNKTFLILPAECWNARLHHKAFPQHHIIDVASRSDDLVPTFLARDGRSHDVRILHVICVHFVTDTTPALKLRL